MNIKFYNTNGIITDKPIDGRFWLMKFEDNYSLKENDLVYEIDNECQKIYDLLTTKLFGNLEAYYSKLPSIPIWIMDAGLDTEYKISRNEFEQLINKNKDNEEYFRLLYLYDCRNLIASIQNSIIESKYLFGEFYKQLNENDFLLSTEPINATEVQFSSGLIVTNIFSTLNHIFINYYTILDYTTKLFFEFENMVSDFTKYPKLKSLNKTYGDHKRLSNQIKKDTIFEESVTIKTIITIRNEIVHNSSIDNLPKVYQAFQNKRLVEKYILLPDLENGSLLAFNNRKRFFDNDTKINEILPDLIKEFWTRIKTTLEIITKPSR